LFSTKIVVQVMVQFQLDKQQLHHGNPKAFNRLFKILLNLDINKNF
jgi:hypothetical protein